MKTFRILPDVRETRAMYWDFEDRVAMFCEKYLPDTPKQQLVESIRAKWVQSPTATFYCIGYDDAGEPSAHLCAYVLMNFGQPFVEFYQIEFDPKESLLEPLHKVADEIARWVQALNDIYKAAHSPMRITWGESQTWVDARIYERMFKNIGFTPKANRTVMRWDFGNFVEAEEPQSIALPKLVS